MNLRHPRPIYSPSHSPTQQIALVFLTLTSLLLLSARPTRAQIVPDSTLGTERSIVNPIDALTDRIDGGAQRGTHLFHSFDQFNTAPGRAAYFANPATVQNIFSRVTGPNPSHLFGTLGVLGEANLFFLNPNGILFGPNARLDIRGSFIASTADRFVFPDGSQFSARHPQPAPLLVVDVKPPPVTLEFEGPNGAILNAGQLTADPDQTLSLIASTVANTGTLTAPGGEITLLAIPDAAPGIHHQVQLDSSGQFQQLSSIAATTTETVPAPVPSTLTDLIIAAGEDTGLQLTESGTLQLASPNPTSALDISPTPGTTIVSGNLNVSIPQTSHPTPHTPHPGKVQVFGDRIAMLNATIDASGDTGGGTVLIGGDYQGRGIVPTASRTVVDRDSTIRTDALEQGDGGRVIVWADEATAFAGNISARGGSRSGDGGFVEVSGKETLTFQGRVDTGAVAGEAGTLLLDPTNIEIRDGSGDGNDNGGLFDAFGNNGAGNNGAVQRLDVQPTILYESELEGMAGNTNLILEASNTITIADLADDVLDLQAGSGSIVLTADADGDGVGAFVMDAEDTLRAPGRDLTIAAASIAAGTLDTSSEGTGLFAVTAAPGGAIDLRATHGNLTTSNLKSSSSAVVGLSATASAGGDVRLAAAGNIDTGNIDSFSSASALVSATAGTGGMITANAGGHIRTGNLDARSATGELFGSTVAAAGGDVRIHGGGGIATGDIDTLSSAGALTGTPSAGPGGDIVLHAGGGDLAAGDLNAYSSATAVDLDTDPVTFAPFDATAQAGGTIDLKAAGNLTIGKANTVSLAVAGNHATTGTGGDIQVHARGNISAGGFHTAAITMSERLEDLWLATDNPLQLLEEPLPFVTVGDSGNITVQSGGDLSLHRALVATTAFSPDSGLLILPSDNSGDIMLRAEGAIHLSQSNIRAEGLAAGRIDLQSSRAMAISDSDIRGGTFTDPGGGIHFAAPSIAVKQTIINGGTVGAGAGSGIHFAASSIALEQSFITSETLGSGNAGDLTFETNNLFFRATEVKTNAYESGRGGQIYVKAANAFVMVEDSRLSSVADDGTGNAGDIAISTRYLTLRDGSGIEVFTDDAGRGGNLTINASERVELIGFIVDENDTTALSSQTRGVGNAGNITINTKQLQIRDGASIFSGSAPESPRGRGGNVIVNASESIDLIGTAPDALFSSAIISDGMGGGAGGNVYLNTRHLTVRDGAVISASTLRQEQGGSVEIQAGEIELSDLSPDGRPSGIFALAGNAFVSQIYLERLYKNGSLDNGSLDDVARVGHIFAANVPAEVILQVRPDLAGLLGTLVLPPATGRGGDINIRTERLTVRDGAQVAVSAQFSALDAGDIDIEAGSVLLDRGAIVAETASGAGGNINLRVRDLLLLRHGSRISTTAGTALAGGDGGNIDIEAGFVVAVPGENSDITANAFTGNGGNIRIRTNGIFGLGFRPQLTRWSDITASSEFGLDGTFTLDLRVPVDVSRGLGNLPQAAKPAELDRGCYGKGGRGGAELYDIGRGGMATGPEEMLTADGGMGEWIELAEVEGLLGGEGGKAGGAGEAEEVEEAGGARAELGPPCRVRRSELDDRGQKTAE